MPRYSTMTKRFLNPERSGGRNRLRGKCAAFFAAKVTAFVLRNRLRASARNRPRLRRGASRAAPPRRPAVPGSRRALVEILDEQAEFLQLGDAADDLGCFLVDRGLELVDLM